MLSEYEAQKLRDNINREANLPGKQRVFRDMRDEPAWHLGVAIKCAVCLVILAGLAVIGARTDLSPQAPVSAVADSASHREVANDIDVNQAYGEPVESEHRAVPTSREAENAAGNYAALKAEHHRRAVFDERRRTWEQRGDRDDKRIAGRGEP